MFYFQVLKPRETAVWEQPVTMSVQRYKRKVNPIEARRQQVVAKAMAVLEKSEDDFNNIGKVVAAKLRKMNQQQYLHADKIITEVLYKDL